MEWALALVALALLGVAAVSQRLAGTPITPAILFVAFGLLVGPEVLDGIDLSSSSATVRVAGRGHARARVVLRRVAHRPRCAAPHGRRAGAPARDRPAADDRAGRRGRRCGLRRADHRGGRDPGGRAGADRRRARAGGRHRAARAAAHPPGAQRRERPQRRDLRAAAVRGGRDRRRRIGDLRRPQPRHAAAGGDRLRRAGRRGRRAADRRHRHAGRPARPDRALVAAGHPRGRRRARLRDRERARRIRLHRGVRRGHGVPPRAPARPGGAQPAHRGGRLAAQRRDVRALRRDPARPRADRAELGARPLRGPEPHASCGCSRS